MEFFSSLGRLYAFKCLVCVHHRCCSRLLRSCCLVVNSFPLLRPHNRNSECSLLADSKTSASGGLLLGEAGSDLVGLGNSTGFLEAVEFNVAVAAQVRGDATVGSIGSSTAIHSSLDNGVVDDASINVESLGLGVGTQVDEHLTDGLDGLFGPSSEGGLL